MNKKIDEYCAFEDCQKPIYENAPRIRLSSHRAFHSACYLKSCAKKQINLSRFRLAAISSKLLVATDLVKEVA